MPLANTFIYDTNTLIAMVPNLKKSSKFLLDRFFPQTVTSDSEYVSIDIDIGLRRMAPFVSPLVEGKLVEQRRWQTNIIKPAYIKDKRAPDVRKPVRRALGERIGGTLSGAEREAANIQFELEDQLDMLDRRLEWMAAQDLLTGTVRIAGEGFPTVLLDFGRSPLLTLALSGTSVWGYAAGFTTDGRDPLPSVNLETWQHLVLKESGATMTDIVFTTTPYTKFLNGQNIYGAVNYDAFQTYGNAVNPGAEIAPGAVYKGRWGQYRLWVYNEWFIDDTGNEVMMIPDGTIILSGPQMLGLRAFGIVMDPTFNYASLAYAPKTWIQEDPAQRLIMMQSSPIVYPSRPNASMAIQVCAPAVT